MFEWFKKAFAPAVTAPLALPAVSVSDLAPASAVGYDIPPASYGYDNGEKFAGGFGDTQILAPDYWTLRRRSVQLFETNLYARGMIRRLITNEINTGLHLEAMPEEGILGMEQDALADWGEETENRFTIWGANAKMCDAREARTFGQLQADLRRNALIAGDVLVVLRQDRRTGLPRIQLISGEAVQTPHDATPKQGNKITHGVEVDALGRHVAYWVVQRDVDGRATSKRLGAVGPRSGRKVAWLVYGTDRKLDDVRGKPILSLVLQSLREIDRYRDSTQRKATVNSMLAMFIKKESDKPGTTPITGGAIRLGSAAVETGDGGEPRRFNVAEQYPGLVLDELQTGETPEAFSSNGTDERFGDFEESIIQAVAWANEVPPEIMRLAFSSNYSASQAAINEFKIYLNRVRTDFGINFCQPLYREWLVGEVMNKRVAAPGLLESTRDPRKYDTLGAWLMAEWSGHIKPATDIFKQARGYKMLVDEGWISNDRAARELTGTKFSQNMKRLRTENVLKAEVNAILGIPEEADSTATAALDRVDQEEQQEQDKDDSEPGKGPAEKAA